MNDTVYDMAIIGGGVNGCGIARDAQGRGLKVLLAEQGDLGSATSAASTKLIHGGLRYLEHYSFRLVRHALEERERLWSIAPHIIWPLRFVLPHRKGLRPAWMLRLGLFIYDHLGGRRLLPATSPARARSTFGAIRKGRRSSTNMPRVSNIPTAGSRTIASSSSMPAMQRSREPISGCAPAAFRHAARPGSGP